MSQIKVNSIVPVGGLPSGANGGIIQIVQTIKDDVFTSTQSAGVEVAITGLNATITPSSSSSKILIHFCVQSGNHGTTYGFYPKRGSTKILSGSTSGIGNRQAVSVPSNIPQDTNQINGVSFMGIDTPSTTSATTYTIFGICDGGTLRVNRSQDDYNGTTGKRTVSTITLMEITT